MKRILILGAGTAGTIIANKLRGVLPRDRWQLTILDKDCEHHYQPGFLFLPFGIYRRSDVCEPRQRYLPDGVELVTAEAERIDAEKNCVVLADGDSLGYDLVVIATGVRPCPDETQGLLGPGWGREIHEFYTLKGALALTEALRHWPGGRLVMNIVEMPIKCPVAPLEFVFLADWWFTRQGLRDKVEIELVTPLSGAFTRPIASRLLGELLENKGIGLVGDFSVAAVDAVGRTIADWEGRTLPYDLLVTVPTNMGDPVIERSGLGDELNQVPTHPHTLQSKQHDNIFVIGDATDLPTSKAGSVAHFEAETLTANICRAARGEPLEPTFDGHANCFIESGFGRGILIDFNYDTEPLPGVFPWPTVGPFSLLRETRMNHFAKMWFRWVYWNLLLPGKYIPIPTRMSMAGKVNPAQSAGA